MDGVTVDWELMYAIGRHSTRLVACTGAQLERLNSPVSGIHCGVLDLVLEVGSSRKH